MTNRPLCWLCDRPHYAAQMREVDGVLVCRTCDTIPAEFECPPERCTATYVRDRTGAIVPGHRADYADDVLIFHFAGAVTALPYEGAASEVCLTQLKYALSKRGARLAHKRRRCAVTEALSAKVWAEIPTRPEYQRAFGSKPAAQAEAA